MNPENETRLYDKLYHNLGVHIIGYLEDKDINEIFLNPDGTLWIDSAFSGMTRVAFMNLFQALAIIHTVAGISDLTLSSKNASLETRLPFYKSMKGERFTATVPPIDDAPSFNIRKRSEMIFTLDDYVASNRITTAQATQLRLLVTNRHNILVCGGPGSGKSTLTNALIQAAVEHDPQQRIIILEDTSELQCAASNKLSLMTNRHHTMTDLLSLAMRRRPDRILIGEVRGQEALDMLKAWNVGCPGGICTVHANGPEEALQRILDLAMEAGLNTPPISLLLHTVNAVVSVVRRGHQNGFIDSITQLKGYHHDTFQLATLC